MKIAIIGAAAGQLPLCKKAHEMGLETHCFAWKDGAVCDKFVDYFYPIDILDVDRIVEKCQELHIAGVVSNASDLTTEVAAYVAEKMGLNGTPYNIVKKIRDKYYVRRLTENISGLSKPRFRYYDGNRNNIYPCVVKPLIGSGKIGVIFCEDETMFHAAIDYVGNFSDKIIIEEFIEGKEFSVEGLSFHGKHYVIQITDKDSSLAPHFVELGHHQPANIPEYVERKIKTIIPTLLQTIGYDNGAFHVEMKRKGRDIFLIEVNPRGGGDEISNKLVQLSSGIDYLKGMIEIALDIFEKPTVVDMPSYAGIYFLCRQTQKLLPFFENADNEEWLVEKKVDGCNLVESRSNYERNGYLIYKWNKKVTPKNYKKWKE